MPIRLFTRSVGHDLSLALVATSPAAQACVCCFLTPEAGAVVPAVWMDVYKLAYEKACAALAPSRFQVMLQPSLNWAFGPPRDGDVRISAKVEYACLALIALAERYQSGRPVPIREIAEAQGIPARFLTQILLTLKRAGLVISTRGSSGGYRLARPPEQISLIEVLRAVDGYGKTSQDRDAPSAPVLAQIWDQIRARETELLSGTSIAKLLERRSTHDWVI